MPATASRRRDCFVQYIRETIKTARDNQEDFLSIFIASFAAPLKQTFAALPCTVVPLVGIT